MNMIYIIMALTSVLFYWVLQEEKKKYLNDKQMMYKAHMGGYMSIPWFIIYVTALPTLVIVRCIQWAKKIL